MPLVQRPSGAENSLPPAFAVSSTKLDASPGRMATSEAAKNTYCKQLRGIINNKRQFFLPKNFARQYIYDSSRYDKCLYIYVVSYFTTTIISTDRQEQQMVLYPQGRELKWSV